MFENKVIEIIQFLLEESNRQKHMDFSDNKLKEKLSNKGFTEKDIHTALKLFDYKNTNSGDDFNVKQIRTFHEIEKVIIPAKLQGILLRLKESGLISSFELEALIEEIMTELKEKGIRGGIGKTKMLAMGRVKPNDDLDLIIKQILM